MPIVCTPRAFSTAATSIVGVQSTVVTSMLTPITLYRVRLSCCPTRTHQVERLAIYGSYYYGRKFKYFFYNNMICKRYLY